MQANFVQVRIQLMVNYVCMCMYMCVCIMYIDIAPHTVKSSEIQKINTCCENLNVLSFSYKVVLRFIECVSILPSSILPSPSSYCAFFPIRKKFGTHLKMMIMIIIIMRDYLSLNCLSRGVSVHTKML